MCEELTDFGRASVMEPYITDATATAIALSMMANAMDSDEGLAVATLAASLRENLTAIEDLRAAMYHSLHAQREAS